MRFTSWFGSICCLLSIYSVPVNAAWLNDTGLPGEVHYCTIYDPSSFNIPINVTSPIVYGRINQIGITDGVGENPAVIAEIGFGLAGSNPLTSSAWTWTAATFHSEVSHFDQYQGSVRPPTYNLPYHGVERYSYTFRFSLDGGANWTAADLSSAGSNPGLTYSPTELGGMTVIPEPSLVAVFCSMGFFLLHRKTRRRCNDGLGGVVK